MVKKHRDNTSFLQFNWASSGFTDPENIEMRNQIRDKKIIHTLMLLHKVTTGVVNRGLALLIIVLIVRASSITSIPSQTKTSNKNSKQDSNLGLLSSFSSTSKIY